ncbi:MAG: hypothetical protein QOF21_2432 [Actinomycetota bacterium]|jgi:hypothetical protein
MWKGGKTNQGGYRLVIARGHPRGTGRSSYVFEHILAMENFLGRYLVPGETVHHVNGVKDDNRLENLELWCRPQPVGIRAADALRWAYEVIRLYEAVELE